MPVNFSCAHTHKWDYDWGCPYCEVEKLKLEFYSIGVKCEEGHVNNRSRSQWPCYVCHEVLKEKIADLEDEIFKLKKEK